MGFSFGQDDIKISNPEPANQPFSFNYEATNNGPDDPGHYDHVQIWGSDGTVIVDEYISAPATSAGGLYGAIVHVPALEPGYYDVAITLEDGTAAGTTIIVQ
jgi:hypothetical protein